MIGRVLTIAGSDSGGGAGIQADLKTITLLGCYGMSALTALTVQNTLGVQAVHEVPPEFVGQQIAAVVNDIGVDAVKTGMLASASIAKVVCAKLREYNIENLVVDPVMVAKGGYSLLSDEAVRVVIEELIPLADLVTPNIPEAAQLSGATIENLDDMKGAASMIHGLGAKNVLVKGGHLAAERAVDLFFDGESFEYFEGERIKTKNTHGTGCTISAAIAAFLAQGCDLRHSIQQAKQFTTEAIRQSLDIGTGHGPLNQLAAARKLW